MFSIKSLIDSETGSRIPTKNPTISTSFSVKLNQTEARNKVLERANTMKYLRKLKSRLTYATFKVEHGWESRSFEEVRQLYQEARNLDKANTSPSEVVSDTAFIAREPEFVMPKTPVSVRNKRKQSEEAALNRPLTPRPAFSSHKNIQNNLYTKGSSTSSPVCKSNRKTLKGSLIKSPLKFKLKEADKENENFISSETINSFEFTTPPRSLLPRNSSSTVLGVYHPPSRPNFISSSHKLPDNPGILKHRSRSTSPAFEAAETIMMLSSPRPSTPVTPRYSPLESSPPPGPPPTNSLEIHPVQHTYQEGDIFNTTKDPLNLLVTTATYFPK